MPGGDTYTQPSLLGPTQALSSSVLILSWVSADQALSPSSSFLFFPTGERVY